MRAVRIGLVAVGVALLVLGAYVMQGTVSTKHIAGLVLWLVLALVVHDGIISPVVFGATLLARKYGKRIPVAVLAIVQGGVAIGLIFSLIVVPEIYAKQLGTANRTVLPFDYGTRLALLWLAIAVLAAACIGAYYRISRGVTASRQKARPLDSQT